MHAIVKQFTPIERAYLNAVYHYHRENSSTDQDARASKEVFKLIKAGQLELAAVKAGENDVTLEIWTKAVDAANI